MKCHMCKEEPDKLFQVVMKINKELDTSAFSYRFLCETCVEKKGLKKGIIRTKKND